MTDAAASTASTHRPRASGGHRWPRVLKKPRSIAFGLIVLLCALAWAYLSLMAVAAMEEPRIPDVLGAWWQALCTTSPPLRGVELPALALLVAMWIAMSMAMMLPTAAPMLLTYAELSETAERQGEIVPSPLILAAGYLAVWVGFALAAASLHAALISGELIRDMVTPAERWLAAAILIGAGSYQFSALKHACLHVCQHPFRFFFANWTTAARGVFRLGLRQGAYCLGCCWGAMLVMFAVGAMNVVWMAALAIAMTIEKLVAGRVVSHVLGAAFLLTALLVIAL